MYIDFKDPEKTDAQKAITKTDKKPLFSFKKKTSKEESKIEENESIKSEAPLLQDSPKELNILDKIHNTIQKESKKIEPDKSKSEISLLDKLESTNINNKRKNNTLTINKESLNLVEPIENTQVDSKTTIPNTPPSVPKIGKAGFIPFEFKGNAKEYFKIWIVNIALTILTLGIYSAWAKVRTLRYIYGNTYLNNSNFEFNADPKRIFIGRTIIVAFYGMFLLFSDYLAMYKIAAGIFVGFLLLLPWLVRQAISFKLKSASYRNIPFKFHAKARSFYWLIIVSFFLVISVPLIIVILSKISPALAGIAGLVGYIVLFTVIIPSIYRRYKALVINNASYANEFFKFTATRKDAISVFFKMSLLTLGVSILFGGIAAIVMAATTGTLSSLKLNLNPKELLMVKYLLTFVGMLLYLFFIGLYKGISDGYLSNFTRNHTEIKDAKFKGEISPLKLGFISASNSITLVFTLGLLYPWTKLRYLRYKIENSYFACSDYDQFISDGYEKANPLGEEALDFFDIDIGV